MTKFIEVPQEVDEWFSRLSEEDMMPMVAQAVEYASGYLGKSIDTVAEQLWKLIHAKLKEEQLAELGAQQILLESVLTSSYGVFLSDDAVRVRKVLSAAAKASLTEAEGETYDNDFKIAYYPGEYSGRIVEAPDRDMAIYTAGLLDGIGQAEIQQGERDYELAGYPHDDLDELEDRCASGHTI